MVFPLNQKAKATQGGQLRAIGLVGTHELRSMAGMQAPRRFCALEAHCPSKNMQRDAKVARNRGRYDMAAYLDCSKCFALVQYEEAAKEAESAFRASSSGREIKVLRTSCRAVCQRTSGSHAQLCAAAAAARMAVRRGWRATAGGTAEPASALLPPALGKR